MPTFVDVVIIIVCAAWCVLNHILGVHNGKKSCERESIGTLLVTTDSSDGSKYANLIFDSMEDQQITLNSETGTEVILIVQQQVVDPQHFHRL